MIRTPMKHHGAGPRWWGATLAAPLSFGLLCVVACSKSQAPAPIEDFDTGTGSDTGRADTGTAPDTGKPTDGGKDATDGATDGGGDDATDGGASDGGDGSVALPACPKGYVDGPTTAVVYPNAGKGADKLQAITWDELTMAWTTNAAGTVTIHYSDRAKRDDAFTTDSTLSSTLGPFPEDKVAITADGLTMFFLSADHKILRAISRTGRGVAFDTSTVDAKPFERITGPGSEGGATKQLGDLVLSRDGKWLFYTDMLRTAGSSVMLSLRLFDGSWDYPNPIDDSALQISGGKRRHPTGFSGDQLSLFYYDDVTSNPMVAQRTPGSALFYDFLIFEPTGFGPMPAEKCDRVYLTRTLLPDPDAGTDARDDTGSSSLPTVIVHAP